MKFNLKVIAIAAAMVATTGSANAAIFGDFTENGTLVLQAFNTQTGNYYIRDLGFSLNDFLPSGLLASAGDPSSAAVGDKTPNAGLFLNSGNTTNFSDAGGWSAWIAGQTTANIRWNVTAVDSVNVNRGIASSATGALTAANGQLTNFTSTSFAGSVEGYSIIAAGGTPGLSFANPDGVDNNIFSNWGLDATGTAPTPAISLASLGGTASLFYLLQTGVNGAAAVTKFGNSQNFAVASLDASGNFSYTLAPAEVTAVPVPAAAWLLAAGLMGLGGAARRRKAEAVSV